MAGKPPDEPSPTAEDPEFRRARLTDRLARLRAELDSLKSDAARRSDEIASRLADERPAGPLPPGGSAAWARSVRRLDAAADQVEVLLRLLEECVRHASRAVLLVERDGRLGAWRSVGFERPPERAGAARASTPVARAATPVAGEATPVLGEATFIAGDAVTRVLGGHPVLLPRGHDVSAALGARDAERAVLVPFVVRDRVAGAVYADEAGDGAAALDPDGIAVLAYLAGLVVDRIGKRPAGPSPTLRPFDGSTEPARPPAARSLTGPLAPREPAPDPEEARRYARFLAHEIRLYNEPAVLEGLERGNLYARLRDPIDRGRRLYEERFSEEVRGDADHYAEALAQVLAGGRRDILGI